MMTVTAERGETAVRFSDGLHAGFADATPAEGGRGHGFKPHDLIEAALATCIAIVLRTFLARHGVATDDLTVVTKLDLSEPTAPVLRYDYDLGDTALPTRLQASLEAVAAACPVHKTLLSPLSIERTELVL